MKTKRTIAMLLILSLLVMESVAAKTYASESGNLNGGVYTIGITGSTISLTAYTAYTINNTSRSVSISGTYVGDGFIGTRVKGNGNGGSSGSVSASISLTGNNRFVEATSTHSISGWSTTLTSDID